eukprot:463071-Hanusia_phi.AAC.1
MASSPTNGRQSTKEADLARTHTDKAKKLLGSHGRKAPVLKFFKTGLHTEQPAGCRKRAPAALGRRKQ